LSRTGEIAAFSRRRRDQRRAPDSGVTTAASMPSSAIFSQVTVWPVHGAGTGREREFGRAGSYQGASRIGKSKGW